MRVIQTNDLAILELVAIQPLSFIPAEHIPTAERLRRRGLLLLRDGRWYPTASGLTATGRTVH